MNDLEHKILIWAHERGLIEGTTANKQCKKLLEEVSELIDALILKDQDMLKDAIGDCYVVLVNLATKCGWSLQECGEHAYNEIKDRKGQMIDGIFVKEEDL